MGWHLVYTKLETAAHQSVRAGKQSVLLWLVLRSFFKKKFNQFYSGKINKTRIHKISKLWLGWVVVPSTVAMVFQIRYDAILLAVFSITGDMSPREKWNHLVVLKQESCTQAPPHDSSGYKGVTWKSHIGNHDVLSFVGDLSVWFGEQGPVEKSVGPETTGTAPETVFC